MSIYIILFIIFLILIIIFLIYKLLNFNHSIKEITIATNEILNNDTNQLITTSTSNKNINDLANKLNKHLKEIRKQELQYKVGNRELQESITNISHDIRTPLTAIKGYIDLIKKEKLKKNKLNYLKVIETKSDDLINLTEQLYDYSKCLDLKDKIVKEKICINDILENVLLSYYSLIKEKKINPKINISEKKIYRNIDKNMAVRIFENVISNAIKYTDKDIQISLFENGKIIIKNKSHLLDSTSIGKIFDRYYTVESGSKTSGIGLSIAKQLVEINDGTITAKYIKGYLIIEINFLGSI